MDLNNACQILALKDACQILALKDACQILALKDACQILALQDACQILALKDACQILALKDTCHKETIGKNRIKTKQIINNFSSNYLWRAFNKKSECSWMWNCENDP